MEGFHSVRLLNSLYFVCQSRQEIVDFWFSFSVLIAINTFNNFICTIVGKKLPTFGFLTDNKYTICHKTHKK